jgi:hypothetical protein
MEAYIVKFSLKCPLDICLIYFCFSELHKKMDSIIHNCFAKILLDLIMNYMVSAYIHSSFCIQSYTGNLVDVSQFAQLKVKVFEYMPWEFFTFSERHLHHLLGIFRFTSLVHNICGLTVKDTVICNCTALENVSSIK